MAKVNGKAKGNAFEREIANAFSDFFKDTFKRVPQSGALVGGVNRRIVEDGLRKDAVEILAGDIITPEWFPFSLECKSYKDFAFHQVLTGENKVLDEWLRQAEDDAAVSNKTMLLIMKFVRKGIYVCSHNLSIGDGKELKEYLTDYSWYKDNYLIYSIDEFYKNVKQLNIML